MERSITNVCMLAYTHYENDNRVMRYAETLVDAGCRVDVIALRRAGQTSHAVVNGVCTSTVCSGRSRVDS